MIGCVIISLRSTGRKLDFVTILPFATLPVATQQAKVTISQRSLAATSAGLKTAAGLSLLSEEPEALTLGKFKPARVYYRTGAGTTPTERISRITKRKYKTAYAPTDQGYSVSFGKTTATSTLAERQIAIANVFATATPKIELYTFSPEKFRG